MHWTVINGAAAGADGRPQAPGLYDLESVAADGGRLRCTLSVPAVGADDTPLPLVLVLHYAGQPTRFYGRPLLQQLVEPALRPLHALLVAPESRGGQWQDERNEAFVLALLEWLCSAWPVDRRKVIVTGYSMGAIGTWHFITHYPERFAAAIPIAGFPNRALDSQVPVMALHAAADELFPLARLEAALATAQAAGAAVELVTADVSGHYDVNGYAATLAAALPWLQCQLDR